MTAAIARILRHKLQQGIRTLAPTTVGFGVLLLLFVGLFSYTRAYMPARVYAATSSTLNFQARLMSSAGSLVPDGSYSIQFKFYDAVSGGVNEWTETQGAVMVRNGYLSVQLGSVTPFGGSIDWSQEKWMTMNVNSDGEMNPRIKLTAVPYSFRSGQADSLTNGSGTLTATGLAQLSPSSLQLLNTAIAAIRINQTGAGGLLQLQGNGGDVFTVAKNGNLTSAGTGSFQGPTLEIGTATQSGGLVFNDGSSNTGTLNTAALSQNTVYTLPDPGLASAEICLDSGNCGGTGDINQGGNAFGSAVIIGTNDNFALNFETAGTTQLSIDTSGNLNLLNGALQTSGVTRLTSAGALQNVTGNNSDGVSFDANTITSGLLPVARGGTGAGSFTANGVLYGNNTGALNVTTAGTGGQVLLANSSGVPTFTTLSGDITIDSSGVTTIGADRVSLGVDTTGDYVANLGTLTGLSTTGNSGEGSTPSLSVLYGSGANTAVQGNTTIICPSGTGNLTGGGNTITLGAGGTCDNLDTNAAVSFGTSVTTPLVTNSGVLTLQTQATAGADDIAFETAGTEKLRLLENGNLLFEKGTNDVTFAVDTPSGSSATYTFSGATGTVLTTANFGSGLDATYVNVDESPAAGDISGSFSGGLFVNANSVDLGTDTVGDYVANLGTLTGLSTTGNSGEGSLPTLAVLYGSTANMAVEGDTTLVCPAGSGDLTGGGDTITLGAGGTCSAISIVENPVFSTSVTTPSLLSSGALSIASGGSSNIALDSASGIINIAGNDTSLQRIGSGSYTIDLSDAGATTLVLNNSGAGAASLNLQDGGLQIAGTSVLTNGRALENLTGISTTGNLVFDSFGGSSGLLEVDSGGNVSISTAGTDYEVPLTFGNGLTRTDNAVALGGILDSATNINQNGNNLTLSGTGSLIVGSSGAPVIGAKLDVRGGLGVTNPGYSFYSTDTTLSTYGYLRPFNVSDSSGRFEIGAYDINGASQGPRALVLNPLGGNVGIGTDLTPDALLSVGSSSQFQVNDSGTITAAISGNTINNLIINNGALSGVTGITFISGNLDLAGGGIINTGSIAGATTITASGNINTTGGDVQTNTITRLTSTGALQNVTGNNTNGVSFDANTITSGLLPVSRGGTGAGTFTTNGIIYGNNTGALQVTAAGTGGQMLLANASGIPTFTSLSGDITINSSGVAVIGANAVVLGTDTIGNYLADMTIESGGGLEVSGTGSETATASLTVRRDCNNNQIIKWSTSGSGSWNCANDNSGLSDSRIKNNVTTVNDNVFDKLKSVRVVEFDFDCTSPAFNNLHCNTDHQAGVIAQELELIFPELVFVDDNGYKNVRYDILGFYNMRALGQLASIIDAKGDAKLNNLQTGGIQRLTNTGQLQNINGLVIVSGGASIIGGINNNNSGLTNVGSISGATTINASGRITGINGLSVTGETINLNVNSDKATNINTGSSTGTVTIGGGSAQLVINSSAFKVSSAGALSGITTINAGGDINTEGVFQANGQSGLSGTCTGNNSYLQDWTITGGIITAGECRSGGILSDARLKENVVALDDSILTRIKDVNTVNFDFACDSQAFRAMNQTCDKERQTGVIAQELAQIFPELVYQNDDGYYRVKYDALNIYTLKATSQIAQKIDNIEKGSNDIKTVSTNGTVRINENGQLKNINGLSMTAGGVSVVGGIDNNNSGITEAGSIGGVSELLAKRIVLSSQTNEVLVVERDGRSAMTIFQTGALELMFDDERAFAARRASGDDVFSISTSGGLVQVGSAASDASSVLLVLDNIDMEGDPPGINGAQYYNVRTQRFRCFQNGAWHNCLSAANAEYVIVPQSVSWQQPGGDQEFPGAPRVWIDLSQAQDFRITMQLKTVGASRANCYLQYAASDNGPWNDLSQPGRHIDIGAPGSIKSDWSAIASDARGEVLVRIMCRGGNYDEGNAATAAVPEFNSVRVQVR